MVRKVETLEIGPELALSLAGSPLPVFDVRIAVVQEPDACVAEVRLLAELDPFTWARLAQSPAFELEVPGLDPTAPVRIEASWGADARASLADAPDPYEVAARLRAAEPASLLRQAESWVLVAATQEVAPGLRGGVAARQTRLER